MPLGGKKEADTAQAELIAKHQAEAAFQIAGGVRLPRGGRPGVRVAGTELCLVLEADLRHSGRSLGDCGGERATHQEGARA
jgi:hypothetical protein